MYSWLRNARYSYNLNRPDNEQHSVIRSQALENFGRLMHRDRCTWQGTGFQDLFVAFCLCCIHLCRYCLQVPFVHWSILVFLCVRYTRDDMCFWLSFALLFFQWRNFVGYPWSRGPKEGVSGACSDVHVLQWLNSTLPALLSPSLLYPTLLPFPLQKKKKKTNNSVKK